MRAIPVLPGATFVLHTEVVDLLSDIGYALVRLRKDRGLTQAALAERVGVKRQQIQRWEANRYRTASLARVGRVAEALGWPAATEPLAAEDRASYVASAALPAAPARDLGEVIVRIRTHAPDLAERFGVTSIGVFGSFARGEQGPDSDVDLAVEVERPTLDSVLGPREALGDILGRTADAGSLDTLRPRMRRQAEQELVRVWPT